MNKVKIARKYTKPSPRIRYNVNHYIRAKEVLVVDTEEGNLGIMPTEKALALAEEKGLDLVEVSPKATPPVCKIIDFSKYKYLESKKERKAKAKGKQKDMKEMRFPINIDIGDINHKLKRVREFLSKGHRVKLTVRVKGRPSPGQADRLMNNILTELEKECKIDQPPKKEGRNLVVIVIPTEQKDKDNNNSHAKDKDTQSE